MLGAAGSYGPEVHDHGNELKSFRVGKYESTAFTAKDSGFDGARNPEVRAQQMDALGIDVMGVTISPIFYCYGAGRKIGINYARVCNDEMEQYCDGSPGRFFFLPTLPLQDIKASIAELRRVQGFHWARGVNIATDNIAGRELSDEALFPLYEALAEHDVTIFLHPAPIGTDDKNWNPKNNKKDIFSFGWIAGYVYRESLAYGNLVLGGVLDRFPSLRICVTHGGGFVPYHLGRFAEAAVRMPGSRAKRPIREYSHNFYFENSVHDRDCRDFLVKMWGIDNIYTGSNYDGWDQNDGFAFAETMARSPEELHKLWAANSIMLFNLGDDFGRRV
jgi:aminocarboxymuconate-semialdehyde decarboxylase